MAEAHVSKREIGWRLWQQLPLLVVLVVLWMMLWGSVSPLTVLTGVILSVVVTRVFYLPPVELSGRFHPVWFAVFVVRFVIELFEASFQVAGKAFSPRPLGRSSVLAVQLLSRSDFVMTLTAIAVSLIPGSIVIEVDRAGGLLYIHAIGADTDAEIDKARSSVLLTERMLVKALGSKDDVEKIQ